MTIRAVVFDAYGTLYDVHSVRELAGRLCGAKGELVTQTWRLKQLEYTWLRGLTGAYEDFESVTRAALEYAMEGAGIVPTPALCQPLMEKYLALDLYPGVPALLAELGDFFQLAILSNGSPAMLKSLVHASGVERIFEHVISVDRVRSYKPDPRCYALMAPALGVAAEEILFVSSNSFDAVGAKCFGFKVAWIERNSGVAAPVDSNVGPAELFGILRGRRENLHYPPDIHIGALTELLPLLRNQER